MSFEFKQLPYSYDALEPHIDAKTMEIHHSRHHKAYFTNFMTAINGTPNAEKSMDDILKNISKLPPAIRNNGGGFYNHNFFWNCMTPNGGGNPTGKLGEAITKKFGSFDKFKEEFAAAAATRFGSGWAWLIVNDKGELQITSTANQDNPVMDTEAVRGTPILGIDVWEHAYYLKYQNVRADYVKAFWNVANWKFANGEFDKVAK